MKERAARGRRVYARASDWTSPREFAMSGLAGRTFVREAYLAAGGIALIMIGVSIAAVALTVLDRTLRSPGRPASHP